MRSFPHSRFVALGFAAIIAAICASAVRPGIASAQVNDPIAAANWSTAPTAGSSIVAILTGTAAVGTLPSPFAATYAGILTGAKPIPLPEWIPALGYVGLAAGAFEVGLKIGSTANTKWLHLAGVGLGTTAGKPAAITRVAWSGGQAGQCYNATPGAIHLLCLGYGDGTSGPYAIKVLNGVAPTSACIPQPGPSVGDLTSAYPFMESFGAGALTLMFTTTCSNGSVFSQYKRVLTAAAFDAAFVIDQPLQPYTNQAYGATSGWVVSGGCGDVAAACGFNNGPTNPTACYLSSGNLYCSGTPDASLPFWLKNLPLDSTYSNADVNEMRCLVSPSAWGCPAVSDGADEWAGTGGPKITMPDCTGMAVAACQTAIDGARATAGASATAAYSVTTAPTYDPGLPVGVVVSTLAAAGEVTDASSVTLEINEQQQARSCDSKIDWYHKSKHTGFMLALSYLTCNFTSPPTVPVSMAAWACTSEPPPRGPAEDLDAGVSGCVREPGALLDQPVSVVQGQRSPPIYLNGPAYDPQKWYVATVYSTASDPAVRREWSQLVEPGSFGS